jgi:hypothetical protein
MGITLPKLIRGVPALMNIFPHFCNEQVNSKFKVNKSVLEIKTFSRRLTKIKC